MRIFDYSRLKGRTWDSELLGLVAQLHEYKGRQEMYLRQKPADLDRLIEIAKIQSTEASNEIEGIRTTNTRLKQLVQVGTGLGSAITNLTSAKNPVPVERIGIQNRFGQVGPQDFLMQQYNLTAEDIVAAALRAIARRQG